LAPGSSPRPQTKEARGIGTPATRAEIIGGLKKLGFLIAHGKNIVLTETGLSLFGVLKQADSALVDPGVTAQLECLLDEVLIGKQEMVGAIDAVCDVAQRIIGKLKEGTSDAALRAPFSAASVARSSRSRSLASWAERRASGFGGSSSNTAPETAGCEPGSLGRRPTLSAAQHGVALFNKKAAARQIANQRLVDRRADEARVRP